MQNGSAAVVDGKSYRPSSRSAGSSTRSWRADFGRFTAESGEVANDEVELGQRVWLRLGDEGVIGEDALEVPEAPEESRECFGTK